MIQTKKNRKKMATNLNEIKISSQPSINHLYTHIYNVNNAYFIIEFFILK